MKLKSRTPGLFIVAAALLIAAMFGTASAGSATSKRVNMAVFLCSAANTYCAANLQGAQDAAKKFGNVKLTVFDAQFDPLKQKNQLRDALISGKFNAWLIDADDGNVLAPEIKSAIKKGIEVACVLVPCGPNVALPKVQIPGLVAQIGIGFKANGMALGQLTVKACANRNPCNVFWLVGNPQLPLDKVRTEGLYAVLKQHSNIKVVAVQPGGYSDTQGLTATQNVLQAHPDLNVIVSSGDQMIAGAQRAVAAAGKTDIALIGLGCTFEAKALILAGKQYACAVYLPRTEARVAAGYLIQDVRGAHITNKTVDPIQYSPIGSLGTNSNIAKFTPEFHS